jgi:LysM repeat protein
MFEMALLDRVRRGILRAVERICPFLALESDGHAVVAGFDPEHRCGALLPREGIDRARQVGTCLEAAHTTCPRYLAAMQVRADELPWAPPSPDADLLSTRLILGPESARHALASAGARARTRRWAVGAALALAAMAAVAGVALGALGSLGRPGPGTAGVVGADPTQSATMMPVPAIGGRPTASVPAPTPEATPSGIETPLIAPSQVPTDGAREEEPQIYVVREGDTLGDIANAHGTSVMELLSANDLEDSDVILIGQELVIP